MKNIETMLSQIISSWKVLSARQKILRIIQAALVLLLTILCMHIGERGASVLCDFDSHYVSDNWKVMLSVEYAMLVIITFFISLKSKNG